jgi:hypothetical protein
MPSKLIQVMLLLYRRTPEEARALEKQLIQQRRRIFRAAVKEERNKLGCTDPLPRQAPRGDDYTQLKAMSRLDADSITATWNRDVAGQLTRLYEANPRGNRQYYISNMEQWAAERAVWKDKQIALNTELTTRGYARQRFFDQNLSQGDFIFIGPPPVCEVCVGHFAAGVVDRDTVRRNPAPVHINCPHEWEPVAREQVNCADLWLG